MHHACPENRERPSGLHWDWQGTCGQMTPLDAAAFTHRAEPNPRACRESVATAAQGAAAANAGPAALRGIREPRSDTRRRASRAAAGGAQQRCSPSRPSPPGARPRSAAGFGGSSTCRCGKPGPPEEGTCRNPKQQQALRPDPGAGVKGPGVRHSGGTPRPGEAGAGAHPSAALLTSQRRRLFPEQT